MALIVLVGGLVIAITILASVFKVTSQAARVGIVVAAVAVAGLSVVLASIRYVPASKVGIVTRNAFGPKLTGGRIIATEGEMGTQADVLSPGWHTGYWPVLFEVDVVPLIEVPAGQVGLVDARDGDPLEPGQLFAPEVTPTEFKKMINEASYFLANNGRKGPQSNVLTPGKHRINTQLFEVKMVDATDVPTASVAVLKSNFGDPPTIERAVADAEPVILAGDGEKGVRETPLNPGTYPINPEAYEVTMVSTRETILRFTADNERAQSTRGELLDDPTVSEARAITVRTSDGFTFPVDVRVEYQIEPTDAPVVVRKLRSDGAPLISKMNSTVRAIFRNNAENVKALDYVNQRSQQEKQSLAMLQEEMRRVGVTVLAVRIGDVGNEETLGELLKTQTDREIAVQEQITFQEQQKAAEQRKELTRTEQEAEEEKRLATASYEVQIAEQAQKQRIIEASASAEAIEIEASARAKAFQLVAEQIGQSNAALMELLTIIGENAIEITPRVMVSNGATNGSSTTGSQSPETVALIGTMLDTMVDRSPRSPAAAAQDN